MDRTQSIPPPPVAMVEYPADPRPEDRRPKPHLLRFAAIIGIVGVLAGAGMGYGLHVPPTAPAPVVKTETVTNTVEIAPQACLDAIDDADQAFRYSSKALSALENFDFAAANAWTNRIHPAIYNRDKADCRAAG